MHVIIISLVTLAVIAAVAFAFLRNNITIYLRLVLLGSVFLSIGTTALVATHQAKVEEPVWQPGSISWDHMPLRLYWDGSQYDDFNPELSRAVNLWNDSLGCRVFRLVPVESTKDVTIAPSGTTICGFYTTTSTPTAGIFSVPQESAASTWYCEDGTVDIQTRRLDSIGVAYKVFVHELGHALGLAHDPSGVMSPVISGDNVPPLYGPSDKDVAALKARYCGLAQ